MYTRPTRACLVLVMISLLLLGCTPLSKLLPQKTPAPSDIQTITLEVNQSFEKVDAAQLSLPIESALQRALTRMDLQVVAPGQTADATLTFDLTFTPLSVGIDVGVGTVTCWNGAQVTGQMTLTQNGVAPRSFPVERTNPPQNFILMDCPTPEQAPFASIWAPAILEPLAQVWDHTLLLKSLEDEDPSMRAAALEWLDKHEPAPREAMPAIIGALEDTDENVISTAAFIIGARKEASAVPALTASIQRTDPASRHSLTATLYALKCIGPDAKAAIPALIRLLYDSNKFIASGAASALTSITGQDFGDDPLRWQTWWEQQS